MTRVSFCCRAFGLVVALFVSLSVAIAVAQDAVQPAVPKPAAPATTPATEQPATEASLEQSQQALGNRFERFQTTLLQIAEQMRKADPDRADLMFRALSKSNEDAIVKRMRLIEQLLTEKDKKFGDIVTRQEDLQKTLLVLLELLQSENRLNDIDAERKRIEGLLKDVNKLIGQEKDVRAATERGGNSQRAAEQQKNVADETKRTIEKIAEQDAKKQSEDSKNASGTKPPAGQNAKSPDGSKPDPAKPDEDKSRIQKKDTPDPDVPSKDSKDPKSGDPQQGKPQPGKAQEGQPQAGPPQAGKPQPGKPQPGKPQDGPSPEGQKPDERQTPGKEDLEQAREEMQKAIENLNKKENQSASRNQDEALKRLLDAKEKFEEILRQLREEEKKLTLTALEARFRKMLALQLLVYNDTVLLAKAAKTDDIKPRAVQLSRNEDAIVQEVEKALVLLKEEGSSVAFPEATEAIRDDMQSVVARLDQANVGELTQTIEQNVIEALEEMIDALQKEIEKSKDKDKKDQQEQQQQEPGEDPLVDGLSELKMLRSLQLRINRTTKKLGRLVEGEQAGEPEVLDQLRTLSRRQSKLQQATYDLSKGRNK